MGLFGGTKRREKQAAENTRNHAEYTRLRAMPMPDLAAEVMQRGFGPGGPGEGQRIGVTELLADYLPVRIAFGVDYAPRLGTADLLTEALQVLEHRGLLVSETHGGGDFAIRVLYRKTRAGEEALSARDVATRVGS